MFPAFIKPGAGEPSPPPKVLSLPWNALAEEASLIT
jgi:hypothetical protein